jgi:hypothetical protein
MSRGQPLTQCWIATATAFLQRQRRGKVDWQRQHHLHKGNAMVSPPRLYHLHKGNTMESLQRRPRGRFGTNHSTSYPKMACRWYWAFGEASGKLMHWQEGTGLIVCCLHADLLSIGTIMCFHAVKLCQNDTFHCHNPMNTIMHLLNGKDRSKLPCRYCCRGANYLPSKSNFVSIFSSFILKPFWRLATAQTSPQPFPSYNWAFWEATGKLMHWQASKCCKFGRSLGSALATAHASLQPACTYYWVFGVVKGKLMHWEVPKSGKFGWSIFVIMSICILWLGRWWVCLQ